MVKFEPDASIDKHWSRWLVRIQLLLLVSIAVSIVAMRFGWVQFGPVFRLFIFAGPAALAVGLLSLVVLVWGLWARRANIRRSALWGVVLGLLPVIVLLLSVGKSNLSVPPIHDISTNTENPPQFEVVKTLRKPGDNSASYGGEVIAAQQHEATIYRDIKPLELPLGVPAATELAATVATNMGWRIVSKEPQSGHLEAVDRTFLLGFSDDVVVRIQAYKGGSRVDVRSASRLGQSDLGANAKRIRAFLQRLRTREGEARKAASS